MARATAASVDGLIGIHSVASAAVSERLGSKNHQFGAPCHRCSQMGRFALSVGGDQFIHPEMQDIVGFLVVDPGPLVVEIVFIGHPVGIVAHGPVSGFGASQMVKKAFVDPIGKIIAAHKADLGGIMRLEVGNHLVQGLVPCRFAKTAAFLDKRDLSR